MKCRCGCGEAVVPPKKGAVARKVYASRRCQLRENNRKNNLLYYYRNTDKCKAASKKWREENGWHHNRMARQRHAKAPEIRALASLRYRTTEKGRETNRRAQKRWNQWRKIKSALQSEL